MHKTTKIAGFFISHIHFLNSFNSIHFKQTNLEQIKFFKTCAHSVCNSIAVIKQIQFNSNKKCIIETRFKNMYRCCLLTVLILHNCLKIDYTLSIEVTDDKDIYQYIYMYLFAQFSIALILSTYLRHAFPLSFPINDNLLLKGHSFKTW